MMNSMRTPLATKSKRMIPDVVVVTRNSPPVQTDNSVNEQSGNCSPRRRTADSSVGIRKEENNNDADSRRPSMFLTPQPPPKKLEGGGRKRIRARSIGSSRDTTSKVVGGPDVDSRKSDSILVSLRIRPLLDKERDEVKNNPEVFASVSQKSVAIAGGASATHERKEISFDFARVFDSREAGEDEGGHSCQSQQDVYNYVAKSHLESFLAGYNCSILAYGQTGSGKTYSMFGTNEELGIIPRFCRSLFNALGTKVSEGTVRVEMAYFEIYQEQVHDLLYTKCKKPPTLRVREHPQTGPYVEGLSYRALKSESELEKWLQMGQVRRATASTGMNDHSSRSHAIFQLRLTQVDHMTLDDKQRQFTKVSQANLVDLAGSERSATAQEGANEISQKKERYKETVAINTSLHMLKRVITVLASSSSTEKNQRKSGTFFVPYRDSALTWLLKESLGGNSRTSLLITASPLWSQRDETISSLRFGSEASTVVTSAYVNEDQTSAVLRRIKELEEENARLAEQFEAERTKAFESHLREIELAELREQLEGQEEKMEHLQKSFDRRLKETEDAKREMEELALFSVTTPPRDKECLIEVYADPLMEHSVSVLRIPETTIGSGDCEIWRNGLYSPVHCTLRRRNCGKWMVQPTTGADVYINGVKVEEKSSLDHLDHLCLGGERFFLCWLPTLSTESRRSSQAIKLELAKHCYSTMRLELFEKQWPEMQRKMDDEAESERREVERDLRDRLEEQERARRQVELELEEAYKRKVALEDKLNSVMLQNERNEQEKQQLEGELDILKKRHDQLLLQKTKAITCEAITEDFNSILLAELRRKHEELKQQLTSAEGPPVAKTKTLACLMFKIDQANNILKDLGKDFMRFDLEGQEENLFSVRLTNTKQGLSAVLPSHDFLSRIEVLQAVWSGDKSDKDLEKLIYNPNDDWQKTAGRASDLFSTAMVNALKKTAEKRGSNVQDVRKSVLSGFSKDRRSTLSALLELSSTDESECFVPACPVSFWCGIQGIFSGFVKEDDDDSEGDGATHCGLAALKEIRKILSLVPDLLAFQVEDDERMSQVRQATVVKMLIRLQKLRCYLRTLAPCGDISKIALSLCDNSLREWEVTMDEMGNNFSGWMQARMKGLDSVAKAAVMELEQGLVQLVQMLGYYFLLANESNWKRQKDVLTSVTLTENFFTGFNRGFDQAVAYLEGEKENDGSIEPWVVEALKGSLPFLSELYDYLRKNTKVEHFEDVGITVVQPLIHCFFCLLDYSVSTSRRNDVFADAIFVIQEQLNERRESLGVGNVDWLNGRLTDINRTLNAATSELSSVNRSFRSSLLFFQRIFGSPNTRSTSRWAKKQMQDNVNGVGVHVDSIDL